MTFAQWWERLTDVVVVPLLGAFTTYNVVKALPPLGGADFPVANDATLLAAIVAAMLIVKVALEEVAARWFPERLSTVLDDPDMPGTTQKLVSAAVRLALFLFVSAAFIGMPWQLWVAGVIWILPSLLALMSGRLPNAPRLWQAIPENTPALGLGLLVFLILAGILGRIYGIGTTFALMSFVILLIPDLIVGVMQMFGREPREGDVRWYLRPSMVTVYRVGGVVVLVITSALALRTIGIG